MAEFDLCRWPGQVPTIEFLFDGAAMRAYEGHTVAIALWVAGVRSLRVSPNLREPRGMFCAMGSCQECVVLVDGRRCEACLTVVRQGMSVQSIKDVGAAG